MSFAARQTLPRQTEADPGSGARASYALGAPHGLRFAMLTTFYPPYSFGGDAIYVRRLTHALARRGHTVDVIHDLDAYHVGGGKRTEPLPEPRRVRTHGLRSRSSLVSTLATHQLGRPVVHGATIRRILDQGFDVIHFHNISLIGGPGLLGYGTGVKLYTPHEHWLVCPTHILWRHGREPCTGRECLRCQVRAGRPPQLWRYGSFLEQQSRHVDVFFALSSFSAAKHREFGFHAPMTVFPSFLPAENDSADRPVAPASAHVRPYFLFVGRLEEFKGLKDLIPHFDAELPADLLIAGTGAQEAELRALAHDRPSVRFLGHILPAELRNLYRNALALVVPSRCFEVFPMVVLEAFRDGAPIVARRLGPFPEIIEQSHAGFLFDTGAELRTALHRLVAEPGLRSRLGDAARCAFDAHWSEDVVLSRYFAVIRSVAEQRGLRTILDKFAAA